MQDSSFPRRIYQSEGPKAAEVRMLDNKGFDLWADGYDRAVGVSDDEKTRKGL